MMSLKEFDIKEKTPKRLEPQAVYDILGQFPSREYKTILNGLPSEEACTIEEWSLFCIRSSTSKKGKVRMILYAPDGTHISLFSSFIRLF